MRTKAILPIIFLTVESVSCGNQKASEEVKPMRASQVRSPVVAGSFYPADPDSLAQMVDGYLGSVEVDPIEGEILGLVSPHAGYPYSGQTAAYGYKLVTGKDFSTVVLIGPSHQAYFPGISVYPTGAWRSPLGDVKIDEDLAKRLIGKDESIRFFPEGHSQEHSLEVQIPFLQRVMRDFKIVPIVIGGGGTRTLGVLADALTSLIEDRKVLVVASSDLYHGYSYDECRETDSRTVGLIQNLDPDGLARGLADGSCQACGGMPIVVLLLTARRLGFDKAKLLHYTNSGDVTGDRNGYVVGYSSIVVYGEEGGEKESMLSPEEESELLRMARETIESKVRGKPLPKREAKTETLREERGVFVTIKKGGRLRGCIGYIQPTKPLFEAVADMAVAASTGDPRFPPVTEHELAELEVEISVLTPLKRIEGPGEIEVGRDGICIVKGPHSGLLLPQVATQYGWDRMTFLEETCHKAGLPSDAWQQDAAIYTFSAQIFAEHE